MTIAVGMLCSGGVIFGADTDESIGEMRRRVHKIPMTLTAPYAMLTGACENGHLMDTAVERIFDGLNDGNARTIQSLGSFLRNVMLGLYKQEFKFYPDQNSTRMRLLFAVKRSEENTAAAWSIDCDSVHRMRPMEIVGYGELVQFVADHLYVPNISLESGKVAMAQILSIAKKVVQFVGGETYVHILRDDGRCSMENLHFSPDKEDIYEYFITMGRELLLATGNKSLPDEEIEKIGADFMKNLKWKRNQILRG